jgi:hypothetical protein
VQQLLNRVKHKKTAILIYKNLTAEAAERAEFYFDSFIAFREISWII